MGETFRRLLLLGITAGAALAQSDPTGGFVRKRVPAPGIPAAPCRRVPPQERIAPPDVDRKMVIPFPKRTGDEKMVIKPAPVCPDK